MKDKQEKKEAQEKITIDARLEALKTQQKDVGRLFDKIQGAIEVLEKLIEEDNPSEKEG